MIRSSADIAVAVTFTSIICTLLSATSCSSTHSEDSSNNGAGGAANGGATSFGGADDGPNAMGSGGALEDGSNEMGSGGTDVGSGGSRNPTPYREDQVIGSLGKAFVPTGITLNYTGMDDGGLEIVAYTVDPENGILQSPVWFVAVKNTGVRVICLPRLNPEAFNVSGLSLGKLTGPTLSSPIWSSNGRPTPCLGPGQVGMGEFDFNDLSFDRFGLTRIDYTVDGTYDDAAVDISDQVVIQQIQKKPIGESTVYFSGTLQNGSFKTIENPNFDLYIVDPKGRPYAHVLGIDLITVAPSGNWDFESTSYDGVVDNFVAYVDYDYPL